MNSQALVRLDDVVRVLGLLTDRVLHQRHAAKHVALGGQGRDGGHRAEHSAGAVPAITHSLSVLDPYITSDGGLPVRSLVGVHRLDVAAALEVQAARVVAHALAHQRQL
jgi:hypothetical protein